MDVISVSVLTLYYLISFHHKGVGWDSILALTSSEMLAMRRQCYRMSERERENKSLRRSSSSHCMHYYYLEQK